MRLNAVTLTSLRIGFWDIHITSLGSRFPTFRSNIAFRTVGRRCHVPQPDSNESPKIRLVLWLNTLSGRNFMSLTVLMETSLCWFPVVSVSVLNVLRCHRRLQVPQSRGPDVFSHQSCFSFNPGRTLGNFLNENITVFWSLTSCIVVCIDTDVSEEPSG